MGQISTRKAFKMRYTQEEIYKHLTGEDKAYYAKAIKEQLAYVPNQNLERWLDERDN